MTCKTCKGERWVCENHRHAPWNEKLLDGCECGAGAPCDDCNNFDAPQNPPEFSEIVSVQKGTVH